MEKAIIEFRKRREARLKQRKYRADAEPNWITVENGEHVPLAGGKAIGGPLKGRDFSKAKSNPSASKGTATPTQKLSKELKKAVASTNSKTREENIKKTLAKAENGAKIYLNVGGRTIGYKKVTSDPLGYGDVWMSIHGDPTFSYGPHGSFSDHMRISTSSLASAIANDETVEVHTSLVRAKQGAASTYPLRSEHGKRNKVGSATNIFKEMGTSKELQKKIMNDESVKKSAGNTKTIGVYSKAVSNTPELFDAIRKPGAGLVAYHVQKALKEAGISGYDGDAQIQRDGNKCYVVIRYKESHGRGKKATYREERHEIKVYGTKETYVNGVGNAIGSEINPNRCRIKVHAKRRSK